MSIKKGQGYILGCEHDYSEFNNVFTIDQFLKSILQGQLPHYDKWIIGQGLSYTERKLLLKLQAVCPTFTFIMPCIEHEIESQKTVLQHFYVIAKLHYQAEIYFTNTQRFQDARANTDSPLRADQYYQLAPVACDTSKLTEAAELILMQGLAYEYNHYGDISIKGLRLNQVRKLFPLTISAETQLYRTVYANTNFSAFNVKTRFYQDDCCVADLHMQVEIESEERQKAMDSQIAERVFVD